MALMNEIRFEPEMIDHQLHNWGLGYQINPQAFVVFYYDVTSVEKLREMVKDTLDFVSTDFKTCSVEDFPFSTYDTEKRATLTNTSKGNDFKLQVQGIRCPDDLRLEVTQVLAYIDQASAKVKCLGELHYNKYNR